MNVQCIHTKYANKLFSQKNSELSANTTPSRFSFSVFDRYVKSEKCYSVDMKIQHLVIRRVKSRTCECHPGAVLGNNVIHVLFVPTIQCDKRHQNTDRTFHLHPNKSAMTNRTWRTFRGKRKSIRKTWRWCNKKWWILMASNFTLYKQISSHLHCTWVKP